MWIDRDTRRVGWKNFFLSPMIKLIEVSASAILWVTAAVSFLPMPEAKALDRLTSLDSIGNTATAMITDATLF